MQITYKGIRLRAGTYADIYNTIVTGKANGINGRDSRNFGFSLSEGKSKLQHVILADDINVADGPYTKEIVPCRRVPTRSARQSLLQVSQALSTAA